MAWFGGPSTLQPTQEQGLFGRVFDRLRARQAAEEEARRKVGEILPSQPPALVSSGVPEAKMAAERQRKRARGTGTLVTGLAGRSTPAATAVTTPKTLLGY